MSLNGPGDGRQARAMGASLTAAIRRVTSDPRTFAAGRQSVLSRD
jgi:hypothetical protein